MWICGIPEPIIKQLKYKYNCPNCGKPMYIVNIYKEEEKDVVDLSSLLEFEFFCEECGCHSKLFPNILLPSNQKWKQ